jgi:5-methylthioribose kinase
VAAHTAGLDAEARAAAAARAALLLEYRHALAEALEAELGFEIARTVVGDAAVAELNALAPAAPAAGSAAAAAGVPAAPPGGDVVPLPCSDS